MQWKAILEFLKKIRLVSVLSIRGRLRLAAENEFEEISDFKGKG